MDINQLKHWFGASPIERRGSFVLVLLIVAIGAIYLLVDEYYNPIIKLSERDIALIDSLLIVHETKKVNNDGDKYVQPPNEKVKLNPRQYDPNTITHQELLTMGVPAKTATIWINFREKGGRFRKPADIQNIYTLDAQIYRKLLPFTKIMATKRKTDRNRKKKVKATKAFPQKEFFPFNPNTISRDSLDLLNIPSRLASSILGYRKAGGTFRYVDKLKSSPGMTDSIFRIIAPYVKIDSSYQLKNKSWKPKEYVTVTSKMEPINLNTADSSELVQIKGIGPVRAKVLIERRENIGGYYDLDQLYDGLYSLDTSAVDQISRYLYVDDSYRRIDLQAIDKWELIKNYYFSKNMATTAVNYFRHRDQRSYLDDFMAGSPLSHEKWEKVRPYLTLEE